MERWAHLLLLFLGMIRRDMSFLCKGFTKKIAPRPENLL